MDTVLGMSLETYALIHTLISLAGIATGLVVLLGLVKGKRLDGWTAWFLATTVATSVTGFGFPFHELLPAHIVGILSLVVLAVAIAAWYAFHLRGGWRRAYVVSAAIALYLNVFVLVVQAFQKISPLRALAPRQTEPPFVVAQAVVFVSFVVLTVLAARRFGEESRRLAPR